MLTTLQCFLAALRCWKTSCVTRDQLLDHLTSLLVGVIGTTESHGAPVAWYWQWLPQYQHWHLPWDIVHGHPSVVQHRAQNGAKPQGGLWVVVGIVADHRCPAVLSCVVFPDTRLGLFKILLFPVLHHWLWIAQLISEGLSAWLKCTASVPLLV